MNSTVWVVEQGNYSDYRVIGVFSSEALAQALADAINAGLHSDAYGKAHLAEWPLDPLVDEIRQGLLQYEVVMQVDGTVDAVREIGVDGSRLTAVFTLRTALPAKKEQRVQLLATVWAKDDTHAVKIVNEHRTRMIATGEWVPEAAPQE